MTAPGPVTVTWRSSGVGQSGSVRELRACGATGAGALLAVAPAGACVVAHAAGHLPARARPSLGSGTCEARLQLPDRRCIELARRRCGRCKLRSRTSLRGLDPGRMPVASDGTVMRQVDNANAGHRVRLWDPGSDDAGELYTRLLTTREFCSPGAQSWLRRTFRTRMRPRPKPGSRSAQRRSTSPSQSLGRGTRRSLTRR
jgi:hypothetical protein